MAEQTQFLNQVFPPEILKKILERLDIKSLCSAKQTCKHWKNIINTFKLMENASSKYMSRVEMVYHLQELLTKVGFGIKKLRFCYYPLNHSFNAGSAQKCSKRKDFWK